MTSTRIIIFAKAPLPGFAKTRLIPALGAEGAAKLAQQMLINTLHEALAAGIGTVELCGTPKIDDVAWQGIKLPLGIEITDQGEGDLGARLARASERVIENAEAVLLIGTDCVEMSATLLREAAQSLHEHDAVIHCTADGGYALLGLKRYSAVLFSEMPWSTDAVARTTIARIGQLGWSLHVGQMLHDVDAPQDLKYLSPKMVVA
ncbi:MAG: TIGR04282 family arsenosugar biosynthesis glycosyltransferase [Nitrosomonadales bacterium]|nr:TIGR04282 family arsenosugar biosynthesis glycosyltransferase [Nitrosomonadales bacterium]